MTHNKTLSFLTAAVSSATVPNHGRAPASATKSGLVCTSATKCAPAECPIKMNWAGSAPQDRAWACAAAKAWATSRACSSGLAWGSSRLFTEINT